MQVYKENIMSFCTSKAPADGVGMASLTEIQEFIQNAGNRLVVIDLRNPDPSKEPGDVKSIERTLLPSSRDGIRPHAINLPWDRTTDDMPLPDNTMVPFDTPIITHCNAGARGLLGKEYLMKHGYTNVINGAGPKETELWNEYGHL